MSDNEKLIEEAREAAAKALNDATWPTDWEDMEEEYRQITHAQSDAAIDAYLTTLEAAERPTLTPEHREELARLISPWAWRDPVLPETYREGARLDSLETADAILARFVLPVQAESEWEHAAVRRNELVPAAARIYHAKSLEDARRFARENPSYSVARRTPESPAGPWEAVS